MEAYSDQHGERFHQDIKNTEKIVERKRLQKKIEIFCKLFTTFCETVQRFCKSDKNILNNEIIDQLHRC